MQKVHFPQFSWLAVLGPLHRTQGPRPGGLFSNDKTDVCLFIVRVLLYFLTVLYAGAWKKEEEKPKPMQKEICITIPGGLHEGDGSEAHGDINVLKCLQQEASGQQEAKWQPRAK